MFKKGIARRWLFNSLGVMILLFTACIAALSFVVQSYAYNGIQMTLIGRSDELPTVLSGSMKTVSEFNAAARSYTENFPDKDLMEVMAVSRSGSILSTSSGFARTKTRASPILKAPCTAKMGTAIGSASSQAARRSWPSRAWRAAQTARCSARCGTSSLWSAQTGRLRMSCWS